MRPDENGNYAIRFGRAARARIRVPLCGLTAAALLLLAPAARGADRIYWANDACCNGSGLPSTISYANLDGSGGAGDLISGDNAQGTIVDGPMGLAIDSATGRIYWANWGYVMDEDTDTGSGTTISWANLDGSGSGDLTVTGSATVDGPHGIAIDPVARKLYWTNVNNNTIDVANLDGSNSAVLASGGDPGVTVNQPRGLAIDPTTRKIYWANWQNGVGTTISWSNLDGTAADDLMTDGAAVDGPEGVAIDPGTKRIYWGNFSDDAAAQHIAYANLDGSGGAANLPTPGATVDEAHGVAIDPTTGTIYWANFYDNVIARAGLDGLGGDDFLTAASVSPVRMDNPDLPVILKAPSGAGAPGVSGGSTPGSTLSCSQGSWAADIIASLFYRAPHTYAYQWSRDGADIPGATNNTIAANTAGAYRCRVTAANAAGSAAQTSNPRTVASSPAGVGSPSNSFRFGHLTRNESHGTAKLVVGVPGPGVLTISDHIASGSSAPRLVRAMASKAVHGRSRVRLPVRAAGRARQKLKRTGRVWVRVKVSFTPAGGQRKTRIRVVKLKKRI